MFSLKTGFFLRGTIVLHLCIPGTGGNLLSRKGGGGREGEQTLNLLNRVRDTAEAQICYYHPKKQLGITKPTNTPEKPSSIFFA